MAREDEWALSPTTTTRPNAPVGAGDGRRNEAKGVVLGLGSRIAPVGAGDGRRNEAEDVFKNVA